MKDLERATLDAIVTQIILEKNKDFESYLGDYLIDVKTELVSKYGRDYSLACADWEDFEINSTDRKYIIEEVYKKKWW